LGRDAKGKFLGNAAAGFLQARGLPCHPTNSIKALKEYILTSKVKTRKPS